MFRNPFRKHNLSLEELRAVVEPIAHRNNVLSVSLFGSRARGDYSPDSDYDFLIDVPEDYTFSQYLAFTDQLSERLGTKVDVVTRRSLKDNGFSRTVIQEEVFVC